MSNRKNNQTQSNKVVVIAIVLVVLIIASLIGGALGWLKAVTYGERLKQLSEKPVVAYTDNGEAMHAGSTYAMPQGITYTNLLGSYYHNGEIMLRASLSNSLINAKYEWSADFENSNSDWAAGKNTETYFKVEPVEEGSDTAILKYVAKFAEPIVINVKVLGGTGDSASCIVNCLQSATISDCYLGCTDFSDAFGVESTLNFDTGTVKGEFSLESLSLQIESNFINRVNNYLTFNIVAKEYVLSSGNDCKVVQVKDKYYCYISPDIIVDYSMFIANFDSYDQSHKEAIYYAWYHAYLDSGASLRNNVLADISIIYSYNGATVTKIQETDLVIGYLTGECFGIDINPDVLLSSSYIVV